MKVLRVLGGLDPRAGGPSVSAITSALATARDGCTVELAAPVADPAAIREDVRLRELTEAGVTVHLWPFGRPRSRYLCSIAYSPALARWLRVAVRKVDLVHAHGSWLHTTAAAVRAARRWGRPVILSPHESLTAFDLGGGRSRLLHRLKPAVKRYYLRNLDAIVFASALERSDSIQDHPVPTPVVIPHAVVDDRRCAAPQRSFADGFGALFQLGYLGRLHPKKNLELILDALALLPPQVRLRVAGDGESDYVARLRAHAERSGLAPRIEWLGFVQADAKTAFLRAIDALLMPSVFEGFGMAAAEAMAAGTPVLVTPQVGIAGLVASTGAGRVVPPDSGEIVQVLLQLMHDRDGLRQMSRAAATAAVSHFSFEGHGRALSQLYTRVTAERRNAMGAAAAHAGPP